MNPNRSRDPEALLERFKNQILAHAEKADRISARAADKGFKQVATKAARLGKKLRTAAA